MVAMRSFGKDCFGKEFRKRRVLARNYVAVLHSSVGVSLEENKKNSADSLTNSTPLLADDNDHVV